MKVYVVVSDDGHLLAVFSDEAMADKYASRNWRSVIEMEIDAEVAKVESEESK